MKHPQQRSGQDSTQVIRHDMPHAGRRGGRRATAAALLLAATLGLPMLAAHAADGVAEGAGSSTAEASGVAPQAAEGLRSRSLTLTLMNSKGGAPAPNTAYRLFVTGKDDAILDTPSGDGILHGVTDAQGRTAPARTTLPHAEEDFTLIRRIGDGPWGHFFQLQSSGDKAPLPAWPYIMTMHQRWGEQWVDLGYTNRQGATAYFSHHVPAGSLSLSIDSPLTYDRPCFDELDAINRKFAQDDAQGARELIAAMRCADTPQQRLDLARMLLSAGQPELARHWLMQARQRPFPDWMKPIDTSLLGERLMVERLLGMPDLVLADAQAMQARQWKRSRARTRDGQDWANSTAYYLADFPDYLAQAEDQARESIKRFGARPYNRGTLGWILALRGQTDEGLRLMRDAYRDVPRDQEMVADYGLALWRDGQREQAVQLWDEAQRTCVWGLRLYTAMQEAAYPHPYFQPSGSSAVKAYRDRCDGPRTKAKSRTNGQA
ncbi:hypothetical protein ABE485_12585 [Achromobacter spanius]|uniref:tetratricopeptide repeat protein n=1 Tax=Achromobacter spanius TaxID=217203 RepID=UPI00320A1446